MKNTLLKRIIFSLLGLVILASCQKEVSTAAYDESVKDITGRWKIVSLTRNGEDMTERMDLSKFRLVFNADGTYTLEDRFAFIVGAPGTFKLNDPQYPFGLSLKPHGATEATIKFQFPVVKGKRQLSFNMSMGCASNTYQFNFEREEN